MLHFIETLLAHFTISQTLLAHYRTLKPYFTFQTLQPFQLLYTMKILCVHNDLQGQTRN